MKERSLQRTKAFIDGTKRFVVWLVTNKLSARFGRAVARSSRKTGHDLVRLGLWTLVRLERLSAWIWETARQLWQISRDETAPLRPWVEARLPGWKTQAYVAYSAAEMRVIERYTSPEGRDRLAHHTQRLKHWNARMMAFFFPPNWDDGEFMNDADAVALRGPHPAANALYLSICAVFVVGLLWSALATVDEVTRGEGKVIPSSQVQVVQNLEGGMVQEILAKPGDVVDKDQVLLRIDDTGFASSYGEQRARYFSLVAAVARLEAEISETSPVFPVDVQNAAPDILASEVALYQNRQSERQSSIDILRRQVEQKEQEQRELQNRLEQQQRSYQLAVKELEITAPLEKEGAVSKVELLRLERQVNDLKGDMDAARLALPRVEAALQEANRRIEERVLKFRSDALAELADKKEQLARIGQSIVAAEDRVTRTLVRSPVRGTVKQVLVSTVGGVVKPGMDLVEIVPLEDNLLVEARIRPQDIAFIRPGQDVMVKISAYDFSIYGGLPARLEQISADTITGERGESYYLVRVRTERSSLGAESNPLPIIPGMVATVDIITGKKTVLAYMLKPVLKASENALRER